MKARKITYIWHMYHNQIMSAMRHLAPIKHRKLTIRANKDPSEHALRFRLLKRVKTKLPATITLAVEKDFRLSRHTDFNDNKFIKRLHKHECKNCPWDGRSIFPTEVH